MKSRQSSQRRGRWGEVLLGGAVGLGTPVLLRMATRALGLREESRAVDGWAAGLLGALVAGGLARRRERTKPVGEGPELRPMEPPRAVEAERPVTALPRRGPTGRERLWLMAGQPSSA
jgi:hypothetical protein